MLIRNTVIKVKIKKKATLNKVQQLLSYIIFVNSFEGVELFMRYLDFNGLQRYDTKIKDKIDDIDNTIVSNTVKNLVYPNVLTTSNSNTFIPTNNWDTAYICNIPAGEYVLSTYITTSESTIPLGRIAQLQVRYADNTIESITPQLQLKKIPLKL